jgi:hypothetical protein
VSDEYRYRCAHGHEWTSVPVDTMRCPACGTITLRRVEPYANALAALGLDDPEKAARRIAKALRAANGDEAADLNRFLSAAHIALAALTPPDPEDRKVKDA